VNDSPLVSLDETAGLFTADKRARNGWHWRMTIVRLEGEGGGALVVSPVRRLPETVHEALAGLGGVRALLAPNHFHYLGVAEFLERYPGAKACCSAAARPRLLRKTGLSFADADALDLPSGVTLLAPPGLRNGELWLSVETTRGVAWVVSDAFFNLEAHPSGTFGLACRITATTRGLRIGRTFTTLAVADRRAYGAWLLAQLERDRPRVLVPGHGDLVEAPDLAGRLAELASARLRLR
jgi:hypothetical protein